MNQNENEAYDPYSLSYSYSAAAESPTDDIASQASIQQDAVQLPTLAADAGDVPPVHPVRPRKRYGSAIAIALLSLALIFTIGMLAGRTSTGSGTSTASTAKSATSLTTSQTSAGTLQTLQEAAIAKVEPAVVELQVTTAQGQQIGSGVIIDAKGDIITNNHVVNGEQSIVVMLSNGTTEQAQLVGTSAAHDLAVVRIQPFAHMVVAEIGNSANLTVGQEVLAIGNPLGITETATQGIVSALNRSVTEPTGTKLTSTIQTDASINPGNSGGALINLQGQLIGIPTLAAINPEFNTTANGLGFAIPSSVVQTVIQQIIK